MTRYPLKVLRSGAVFLDTDDDCLAAAIALEECGYSEDFCLGLDFDPAFAAALMAAGFLVMSCVSDGKYILLPRHHLIRSCLFFPELHIKKNIRRHLGRYRLFYDRDFELILDKCVAVHGDDWLTGPLVKTIREIRDSPHLPARPVSFALYRDGKLAAGEFGIKAGMVYTSYSGYYDESNAGTVQMILTAQYLENSGFSFWDLGMPLDYKLTIGAREITRKEFLDLFLKAQK